MRKIFWLLVFTTALSGSAQVVDNQVVIGKVDSIYSAVLKEKRSFWVHVPASYAVSGKHTKYPVLYLLDGDGHFPSVTGLLHQLAGGVNGNTLMPEMIVVAILNTDRTRDLTPTAPASPDPQMAAFLKTAGGGENFISFLEKELIPKIESRYNTAPYRVLVGHSFGGLTAMHILMNHTELFHAYIAIDPSMWWDDRRLLKEIEKKASSKKFEGRALYLSIANTLPPGVSEAQADRDTTPPTEHIRAIRRLAQVLGKNQQNGLQFAWNYFPEDDHGSVPLISEYHGLRFIFRDYRINPEIAFGNLDSLVRHYELLTKKMGYQLLPPENIVNQVGYLQLQAGQTDKAITAFLLNVKNYPGSPNVYDSLGDAYMAQGDKKKAIESFEKTLSMDPNFPGTREKLEAAKK